MTHTRSTNVLVVFEDGGDLLAPVHHVAVKIDVLGAKEVTRQQVLEASMTLLRVVALIHVLGSI